MTNLLSFFDTEVIIKSCNLILRSEETLDYMKGAKVNVEKLLRVEKNKLQDVKQDGFLQKKA